LVNKGSRIQGVRSSNESSDGQTLKEKVFALLKSPELEKKLESLRKYSIHRVFRTLLSALCSEDEEIKWHAVTVTGILVADLAQRDMEGARRILRRMIWSLNEGSGGIGWGIPEAMGEILARNEPLAREFAPILVSYVQPEGNFLEFELLQRGILWGIGRLGEIHPQVLRSLDVAKYLLPCMDSPDPLVRGHALWAAGRIGIKAHISGLESLLQDQTEIRLYQDRRFRRVRICDLAREIFERSK
jgi:hypothetical protein